MAGFHFRHLIYILKILMENLEYILAKQLSSDEYANNKKIGDFTEELCKKLFTENGYSITPAPEMYFPDWDFKAHKNGKTLHIEVKSDSSYEYKWSGNVTIEYGEDTIYGNIKPSGISLTKSDYYCVVMHKMGKIFMFKTNELKEFINTPEVSNTNKPNNKAKGKNHVILVPLKIQRNNINIYPYTYTYKTIPYDTKTEIFTDGILNR